MAIVEVARLDLPEEWTALVPGLLNEVSGKQSSALVGGAVSCLSMLCDELEEEQTAQVCEFCILQPYESTLEPQGAVSRIKS